MKRSMELLATLQDIIPDGWIDYLQTNHPELEEVEWDLEISGYTPGRPARIYGPAEDCYPAEGMEYEIDMAPEDVANKFAEVVFQALPDYFQFALIEPVWTAIRDAERQWQADHLDDEIDKEMKERREDRWN
jgi:hypothetical protein